jgi:serine/threonine-protein kinase RsbT
VDVSPETIKMVLADVGPGIPDIELAMKEGYSTAPDEIRSLGFGAGMGLSNMKKYSDYMDIQTELGVGTTITMIVNVA